MINIKFMADYFNTVIHYSKKLLRSSIAVVVDTFPTKRDRLSEKNLIFIAGVEGSGTTLVNKLLSESKNAMSITHHDYLSSEPVSIADKAERLHKTPLIRTLQHFIVAKKFNHLVDKIWHFPYSHNQYIKYGTLRRLCDLKIPSAISNVVIKRSYPSGKQGVIFPNLADLFCISKNIKIIHLKRDLKENAASVLRRGFVNNIEDAIRRVKHAIMILESQLDALDDSDVLTITYEDLVKNKLNTLARLEKFLGYEPGELTKWGSWIGGSSVESRRVLEDCQAQLEKDL